MGDNAAYPVALDDKFCEWMDKYVANDEITQSNKTDVRIALEQIKFRENGRKIEWPDVYSCLIESLEKYEIYDEWGKKIEPSNTLDQFDKNGSVYFVMRVKNAEESWGAKLTWMETMTLVGLESERDPNYEHYFAIEDDEGIAFEFAEKLSHRCGTCLVCHSSGLGPYVFFPGIDWSPYLKSMHKQILEYAQSRALHFPPLESL